MDGTGDKGLPGRSPTGTETGLTCCGNDGPETGRPLTEGLGPRTHGAPPTQYPEGHSRMPFPDQQTTR